MVEPKAKELRECNGEDNEEVKKCVFNKECDNF